MILRRP